MTVARLDLSGGWEFREFPAEARRMRDLEGDEWMAARVPGSVYTNLIEAGRISEEDIAADPEDFMWVSEKSWVYRKRFDVSDEVLGCERVEAVFDGLDTIAHIWLNDKLIGKTTNMFIGHRFEVKGLLKTSGNVLMVKFLPATVEAAKLMDRYGQLGQLYSGCQGRAYVRKAQFQFGWDFCPALPGCGIYRPVRLEGWGKGRIEDVHVRTIDCNDYYADVGVAITVGSGIGIGLRCKLKISGGGLNIEQELDLRSPSERRSTVIRIEMPKLWWPRGCGGQHLYKLEVILTGDGEIVDERSSVFGIRSARVSRSKDEYGESFEFEINDRAVYVTGANWTGLSIFAGGSCRSDYERILKRAAAANINMLRIWGGGNYENDAFYELCDELGIMVWQDFMFASAYYPDRSWFTDIVKCEAESVIRRLRNHCSIVLWCGNSEIEYLHQSGRLGKGKKFYGKDIYKKVLPGCLGELDPDREYIRTTPFSSGKNVGGATEGTFYQRAVWDGFERADMLVSPSVPVPRFVAEIGFQSLPNVRSVGTFARSGDLRIGSMSVEKHNYQRDGNSRMARYLADRFGSAGNLEEQVYLTQLTQAREIKRYAEHLRIHNDVNRGVMLRQLKDCFGAISFSAIDDGDEPKALYYYMRRFFAPVIVSVAEDLSVQRSEGQRSLSVVVVNDSCNSVTGRLRCELIDVEKGKIDELAMPVSVGPRSVSSGIKVPRAIGNPQHPQRCVLRVEFQGGRGVAVENTFLYLPDKYIEYPTPQISSSFEQLTETQWNVSLSCDVMVKDLCIRCGHKAIISDNFIDMFAGVSYRVRIKSDLPLEGAKESISFCYVGQRR